MGQIWYAHLYLGRGLNFPHFADSVSVKWRNSLNYSWYLFPLLMNPNYIRDFQHFSVVNLLFLKCGGQARCPGVPKGRWEASRANDRPVRQWKPLASWPQRFHSIPRNNIATSSFLNVTSGIIRRWGKHSVASGLSDTPENTPSPFHEEQLYAKM